ncbi:hypothetical protein H2203_003312 [Taxawa tesnikishii (nom. ined.)]|nr:hypothetical protein H2203_003312 [Dothideales sp. JES 119]
MNTSPWGVHGDIWDIWMPATSSEHSGPRVRTRLRYQQRLRSIEWGLDALSYPNVLKRNAQRLEISVERLHGLVREYDAAAQQRAALEMELRDNVARFEMWDGDDEVGEQVGEQVWDPTDSEPIGEGEAIQQHLLIGWV